MKRQIIAPKWSLSLCLAAAVASAGAQMRVQPDKPAPWPMDHFDAARTNHTTASGPTLGSIEWKVRTVGATFGVAADSAGDAILGSTFQNIWWSYDVFSYRYDNEGNIEYKKQMTPYPWSASQAVNSFPALDPKGNAVINSTNSQIVRLTPGGTVDLTIQNNPQMIGGTSPGMLGDGSFLHYFGLTGLTKYNAKGGIIWRRSLVSVTDPAYAPNGDVAIGGLRTVEPHGSVDVTYLNADGTIRWQKTSANGNSQQVIFDEAGFLYGSGVSWTRDGAVRWNSSIGGRASLDGLGHVIYASGPTIAQLNRDTGAVIWSVSIPTGGSVVEGTSIDRGNRIYFTTSDGNYGCVTPAGVLLFYTKVCDQFTSQLSISTRGKAFAVGRVGFSDYYLFKLQ